MSEESLINNVWTFSVVMDRRLISLQDKVAGDDTSCQHTSQSLRKLNHLIPILSLPSSYLGVKLLFSVIRKGLNFKSPAETWRVWLKAWTRLDDMRGGSSITRPRWWQTSNIKWSRSTVISPGAANYSRSHRGSTSWEAIPLLQVTMEFSQ